MRYLILLAVIGIALIVAFFKKQSHSVAPSIEVSSAGSLSTSPQSREISPPEIVLGNPDAKDTVVMYFAPTCSHCAEYEKNIIPTLDKEFIQTGKIRFIMRILPFHSLDFAVGKIALFHGQEQFSKTIKLFLENQEKWLAPSFEEGQQKEKLLQARIKDLSQKLNIDPKILETSLKITHDDELAFIKLFCLENGWSAKDILKALKANPEIEKSLASSHLKALKKDGEMVDYVPAFYINDALQDDWVKPQTLKEDLEATHEENDKPSLTKEEKLPDQSSQSLDHTKREEKEESMRDSQNQTLPPVDAKE